MTQNARQPVNYERLTTERLLLRTWKPQDLEPFASLNSDPRVTKYLAKNMTREESDAMAGRITGHFTQHGFGLWAVEVIGQQPFIGFVGLANATFPAHFTPCVEIGWRLACEHWGRGYATEAARAALHFAFDQLQLDEVVSFTTVSNARSRRVMEKLGMSRNPADDFEHPNLHPDHPLRPHVLYRISRDRWSPDGLSS